MRASKREIWRKWGFKLLIFSLIYWLVSSNFSPVTIARTHLVGKRICELATARKLSDGSSRFSIPDLHHVGDHLQHYLVFHSQELEASCDSEVHIGREQMGSGFFPPNILKIRSNSTKIESSVDLVAPEKGQSKTVEIDLEISYSLFLTIIRCAKRPSECSLGLWPGSISSTPYPGPPARPTRE